MKPEVFMKCWSCSPALVWGRLFIIHVQIKSGNCRFTYQQPNSPQNPATMQWFGPACTCCWSGCLKCKWLPEGLIREVLPTPEPGLQPTAAPGRAVSRVRERRRWLSAPCLAPGTRAASQRGHTLLLLPPSLQGCVCLWINPCLCSRLTGFLHETKCGRQEIPGEQHRSEAITL